MKKIDRENIINKMAAALYTAQLIAGGVTWDGLDYGGQGKYKRFANRAFDAFLSELPNLEPVCVWESVEDIENGWKNYNKLLKLKASEASGGYDR